MDQLLEATARAERDHFWFHGFRRFIGPLLEEAASGRRDLVALDCGCGTGHNLTLLRRYGDAVGIDITFSGLKYAVSRGERKVARASAADLPFQSEAFDLVTSFDVISALPDTLERQAIAEMARVLKPGGYLLLNVAAYEWLRGNHSLLGSEVRRYTRPRLRSTLERGGFDVRRLTYTNATILPLVLVVRSVQRITGQEKLAAEIEVPSAPVNVALSTVLTAESLALRWTNMPFGSSVLCLAQKPVARGRAVEPTVVSAEN